MYREHKRAHLSLKVRPHEQGMLNTINRPELVALLIAVRHCRPGSEGEHSNRVEELDAERWHAPKVTVSDSRRLPQIAARSDRARDHATSTSRG